MTPRRPSPDILRGMSADEAAAHWIVRRGGSYWTSEDVARLDAWLAGDESHRLALKRAEAVVSLLEGAGDDDLLAEMRSAALAVKTEWPTWRTRSIAAAAAVAVAIVGLGWLWGGGRIVLEGVHESEAFNQPQPTEVDPLQQSGDPDFATERGQRLDFVLGDGTQITLDTDSAIDVAYQRDRRIVRLLKGRAFFDVAHDTARPFVVQAADRAITAVGTQFDVRLDNDSLRVLLVTGSVHVDHPVPRLGATQADRSVKLEPGDRLTLAFGSPPTVERLPDTSVELLWRRGLVQFDETPLAEAAREINRYATNTLIIREDSVGRLRVSGIFRTGDPARFARSVSSLLPVRVVEGSHGQVELASSTPAR